MAQREPRDFRFARQDRVLVAFTGWLEAEVTLQETGLPRFRLALYRTVGGNFVTIHASDPQDFCSTSTHESRDEAVNALGTGRLAMNLRRALGYGQPIQHVA